MKKIILFTLLIFIYNHGLCQSLDNIDTKIDSLQKIKDYYLNLIEEINQKINDLETKKNALLDENPEQLVTTTAQATEIYINPDNTTKVVSKIAKGEKVEILDYQSQFYKVKYADYIGWLSTYHIGLTRKIHDFKTQKLVLKYGTEIAQDILDEKIWLDMTREMVLDSWGKPNSIKHTVLKTGEYEYWFYENTSLSFQNGKLTSWLDR